MAFFEKSVLVTVGVVFAGLVGYKVIEKKRPDLIKKAKRSASDAKKSVSGVLEGAAESFREGYAKA
jgi:hypothetical protein